MQKAESQHNQTQNHPAQRQSGSAALESPQSERIAQLEAMAEASPQAGKLAQLAAMANDNPRMDAQRKAISAIQNSPDITAQRQQIDSLIGETAQREEAEEPLQAKVAQREAAPAKPNNTGLPDNLKSGIESLSGMSMDNVKVHYNSSQPAQLNALAYAQGTDIHVAPGQEQHLPHEVWHVVQQAQGRVKPTMQMKEGVPVNDDAGLEHEADVMGAKAIQLFSVGSDSPNLPAGGMPAGTVRQGMITPLSGNLVQLYSVTAELLKSWFGFTHIRECREGIGDVAFQYFLKLQTDEMSPLVDFFNVQPHPIVGAQAQCDLLVPLIGAPNQLALMKEALTRTAYNPEGAPAIKDYLSKYQAEGVLALAQTKLTVSNNNPVDADKVMTELKEYNYHESVRNKVVELGEQKATVEHDEAVEENKQKRETYATSYTAIGQLDTSEPDDVIAEKLGHKKATLEHAKAIDETITDRKSFESRFQELTGVAVDYGFTKNEVTKIGKIKTGLEAIFTGEDGFTVSRVKELIKRKLDELKQREISLNSGLEGNKEKYKNEVAKKLGEFETKKKKLDTSLEGNKTKYKDSLKQAITPLFAFPESEAASGWVLSFAGADDKKALQLVTWTLNGLNAKLALGDIQKICTAFTPEKLASFHAPAGGADAKAQELLQLLNEAKVGEDAKFKTLIERDESNDFKELLKFLKEANGSIDTALSIFSKKDKSADVTKLLGKLKAPSIDHLTEGKDYLKHKGKAADASFLKAKGISKVDSELLLAKDWIVGHGDQVAFIYGKSGNSAVRTIAVLDIVENATKPKTPVDVKKWLDLQHSFNNVYNKLHADNNQQFWAGEACVENTVPVVSRAGLGKGVSDSVNTVIANYYTAKTVGQFYSGGVFGNHGGDVMVLPDNTGYQEYDIKPYITPERGKKRIVVGGGNYYFTCDHYITFQRFRP